MPYNHPPPLSFGAKRLEDRVVLVTGASSGIGEAAARLFAREGAKVVATARRAERIDSLAADLRNSGLESTSIVCDVRDEVSIAAAVRFAIPTADWMGRLTMPAWEGVAHQFTKRTPKYLIG